MKPDPPVTRTVVEEGVDIVVGVSEEEVLEKVWVSMAAIDQSSLPKQWSCTEKWNNRENGRKY